MRNIPLIPATIALAMLTACGQVVVNGPFIESDENWPENCQGQYKFSDAFPTDIVFPKSVALQSVDVGGGDQIQEGIIGIFCTKDSYSEIISWYKNKFGPQEYKYFSIDTVHFWKSKDRAVMLDVVKEQGEYVKYTVDVRGLG